MKKELTDQLLMVEKYIQNVLSGDRIAGEYEQLSIKRHLSDIENTDKTGLYFDEKAVLKAFAFFGLLKHSKGEFAGNPFELSDWQAFIIYSIFGWKRKDGTRRFRYAYTEIARKNGKTTFAAAIALYMLVLDGEQGAEVYTAATKHDQAKICWTEAKHMVEKSPALKKYIQAFQLSLVMESTLSRMEPLASNSEKLDGLNVSCAIVDELHAWKDDSLYMVLKSAQGARKQPLMFSITTAGFDKNSPCFSMRKTYIDILQGIKQQDNTFVMIFTCDQADDWHDPQTWIKSNPNLGISISPEYLQEEFNSAINRGGTEEVNFKTKNLNQWVDAPEVWIRDDRVTACDLGITEEMLIGKMCYAGLDLSSHVDITALALFFPNIDGKKAAKVCYFIPESKIEENEDRVDYRKWAAEGRMFVTPGNVIDIDEQIEIIYKTLKKYNCRNLSFDPAKAYHGTIQGLQKKGLTRMLDEFPQNIKNMSAPTRELQKLVEGAEVDLMKDPVIRWMFRNAVAYTDGNDNIKLDKKRSIQKIDGVIALIDAVGGWMSHPKPEPYVKSEVKVLNF